ncbi:MAG: dTMP kinase [Planctomycetota bacterium]
MTERTDGNISGMRSDSPGNDAPLPPPLVEALHGRFIVFEGPDGSGKSTQLRRFADRARAAGLEPVEVREPGGTRIGEAIRAVLLDDLGEDVSVRAETLLYLASRAQLVERVIRPALDAGKLVLADRFMASTVVYQGDAGGLDRAEIERVAPMVLGDTAPDLVVIFDVDQATAASRLNPLLDRMEAKGAAFHARVRRGYLDLAEREPQRHALIDATEPEQTVERRLIETLCARLARAGDDRPSP